MRRCYREFPGRRCFRLEESNSTTPLRFWGLVERTDRTKEVWLWRGSEIDGSLEMTTPFSLLRSVIETGVSCVTLGFASATPKARLPELSKGSTTLALPDDSRGTAASCPPLAKIAAPPSDWLLTTSAHRVIKWLPLLLVSMV